MKKTKTLFASLLLATTLVLGGTAVKDEDTLLNADAIQEGMTLTDRETAANIVSGYYSLSTTDPLGNTIYLKAETSSNPSAVAFEQRSILHIVPSGSDSSVAKISTKDDIYHLAYTGTGTGLNFTTKETIYDNWTFTTLDPANQNTSLVLSFMTGNYRKHLSYGQGDNPDFRGYDVENTPEFPFNPTPWKLNVEQAPSIKPLTGFDVSLGRNNQNHISLKQHSVLTINPQPYDALIDNKYFTFESSNPAAVNLELKNKLIYVNCYALSDTPVTITLKYPNVASKSITLNTEETTIKSLKAQGQSAVGDLFYVEGVLNSLNFKNLVIQNGDDGILLYNASTKIDHLTKYINNVFGCSGEFGYFGSNAELIYTDVEEDLRIINDSAITYKRVNLDTENPTNLDSLDALAFSATVVVTTNKNGVTNDIVKTTRHLYVKLKNVNSVLNKKLPMDGVMSINISKFINNSELVTYAKAGDELIISSNLEIDRDGFVAVAARTAFSFRSKNVNDLSDALHMRDDAYNNSQEVGRCKQYWEDAKAVRARFTEIDEYLINNIYTRYAERYDAWRVANTNPVSNANGEGLNNYDVVIIISSIFVLVTLTAAICLTIKKKSIKNVK